VWSTGKEDANILHDLRNAHRHQIRREVLTQDWPHGSTSNGGKSDLALAEALAGI